MKNIIINAKYKTLGKILNFLIKIINTKEIKINKLKYNIIIMNIKYIKFTNLKLKKIYYTHSGYPGGLKKKTLKDIIKKNYINLIKKSIKNILPKNKIFKNLNKRIKIIKKYSNKFNKNKPKILINDKVNL